MRLTRAEATGTLADHADIESFYRAYLTQMDHLPDVTVHRCNRGQLLQREFGPLPLWSTLTDDRIARGRDITDGGARYLCHSIAFAAALLNRAPKYRNDAEEADR